MELLSILAMWSLGSAAMLGWTLAAAIPLAIHLWSRRRHQEVSWAAMEFLLAAMKKHSRRLRLEQLALLAVRILILLLLALALADPWWLWATSESQPLGKGPTHFILVADTSFSMSYREREQTLLQSAQRELRRLVEQGREGDGFSLITMEQPVRAMIADVSFDRGEVLRQIDRLQISHSAADLSATLSAVDGLATRARERYPRFVLQRADIFSDLARNTWSDVNLASNREVLTRTGNQLNFVLHAVGNSTPANLAITGLTSSHSIAVPGERVHLTADVQAFGITPRTGTRLEFLVNGRVVHDEDIQLASDGQQSVSWDWACEGDGDQVLSAHLVPDDLPLDNERWLVVSLRDSLKVLCVEGEPAAAEFVALALNPKQHEASAIQTTVTGVSGLLDQPLEQYDAIFLCNVGRFAPAESLALHRFVNSGGALVISLGDQVQGDHYNRELAEGPTALLPTRLASLERNEQLFDPLEYRHRLVRAFRGREHAGLLNVPTWCYYRLEPKESATVALAFTSGHPAVVESSVGRGRSVLVATALSPSSLDETADQATPWTALPAWPSFPPLVHQLLNSALQGRENDRTGEVGVPFQIAWPTEITEATVLRPDQQRERITRRGVADMQRTAYSDTWRAGIYQVDFGNPAHRPRTYAANLDTRESNLSRFDRSALPSALLNENQPIIHTGNPLVESTGQQVFRPLLAGVGLLLLVEQLLAVTFARRTP